MNIKNTLRGILYILLFFLILCFILGFLNMLHPLLDSLSHFRVYFLFLILIILLLVSFFHEKRITLIYFGFIIMGLYYFYWLLQPFQVTSMDMNKTNHLKHLQFNLNFKNHRVSDLKEFLKENSIDIVTLQEVTSKHQKILEEMQYEPFTIEFSKDYPYVSRKKGAYPYQQYCEFQSVGGLAILSKYPINQEKSICMKGEGLLSSQLIIHGQRINVVSLHLYWPFPYSQAEQVAKIKEVFRHVKAPLLIAGDFNAVSWSHSVKEIEEASSTQVVNGLRWSIDLKKDLPFIPFMKLSIDHTLLSSEFEVNNIYVVKDFGSDHFPILTKFRY